jgi:hypothetical protein
VVSKLRAKLWIYAITVSALSIAFGIHLAHAAGTPAVSVAVKFFLMPGTLLAFLFPGVHSDFFLFAVVALNIIAYVGAAMVIVRAAGRRGSSESNIPSR